MSSGKYFNKGVKVLDSPHVGHVVRETASAIVVFGSGGDRYDIPKSAIRFVSGNVLVDASIGEIVERYRVSRDEPLHASSNTGPMADDVNLATCKKQYPKSLFNKGVRTKDEEHVGHVMKETDGIIVIWGHHDWRFDVPKSLVMAVGRNVILDMDSSAVFKYRVSRDAPTPAEKA